MKRVAYLTLLLLLLTSLVVGSFAMYLYSRRDTGAVPSAYLAGLASLKPYEVHYAGPDSDAVCLRAYHYIKSSSAVRFIAKEANSRYSLQDNLVYLTDDSVLYDSIEAVHEFGHALDRALCDQDCDYFSRQSTFTDAYATDCLAMQDTFHIDGLFRTEAYRNLAVSDIVFAVFYGDTKRTDALTASYITAGTPYWRHEDDYMADLANRQTEVFANLFTILLSDDDTAKKFLETYFPTCKDEIFCSIKAKKW